MAFKACIDACDSAHRHCMEAAIHCMQQGGVGSEWELVQLLLDTADIAETASDFMLRSSRQHHLLCRVTAEIALRCAEECERHADKDLRLGQCAKACRKAAEECSRFA
ncbi:MAG: four-helix bundle copper-binding protein [Magnetospirillum sp.]|nr:four-helix bundle copper-binding protein [Magnetospirillum sp.]